MILTTWNNMFTALSGMLDKATAHETAGTIMEARLAPDMLPLGTQIRMVTNFPRQALGMIANAELQSNEVDPTTLEEAKVRISETIEMLGAVDEATFLANDTLVDLELPNGMKFRLSAADYVRDWALPNFYFHISTAYAIMRSKGVELGKADLMPHMMRHINMPK